MHTNLQGKKWTKYANDICKHKRPMVDEKLSGYVPTGNFATIESAKNFEVPIIFWKISLVNLHL